MFYWEDGLKLAKADLAIDFRRRQPRAFISHAHTDHMARHAYALCTPATGALYQARYGRHPVREMPYRQPIEWGGLRLTTYPAGHCLGSAMLLAEDEGRSLLYTGDFKLSPSATAEPAELPHADVLIMECTFGTPRYRMPPREETVARLVEVVRQAHTAGKTPVVEAYSLGKSQEVTRLLTAAGLRVLQHRDVLAISRVYEACGMLLGDFRPWDARDAAAMECVTIVPPGAALGDRQAEVRIAVTGWALDSGTRYRLGVDHALPLTDHADYDELLAAVERVQPQKVYCTHGPESFVDRLKEQGWNAALLGKWSQGWLF